MFEVCVAMTLMAIAVVWMLRSFSQTILAVERARDETLALHLVEERALYALVEGRVSPAGAQGVTEDGWRWNVTTAPLDATDSQLRQTQFAVEWSHRGRTHTLTTATWLPPSE